MALICSRTGEYVGVAPDRPRPRAGQRIQFHLVAALPELAIRDSEFSQSAAGRSTVAARRPNSSAETLPARQHRAQDRPGRGLLVLTSVLLTCITNALFSLCDQAFAAFLDNLFTTYIICISVLIIVNILHSICQITITYHGAFHLPAMAEQE